MQPADDEPISSQDVPPAADERQQIAPEPPPRPSQAWACVRAVGVPILAFTAQGIALLSAALLVDATRPLADGLPPEEVTTNVGVQFTAYLPAIALLLLAWRFLDRGTLAQIGHPGPPTRIVRGLAAGLAIGLGLMSVVVGGGVLLGGWRIGFGATEEGLAWLGWTPFILIAAYFEELLTRGYMLQNLGRRWPLVGLVISSVVFALLHLANPNADEGQAFTALIIVEIFTAGLLLGSLFLLSGDLWLPTGVHIGWNWAQGLLFGLPVSGLDVPSIAQAELLEPSLLTGSAFGPESSLLAVGVTAAAAGACLWLAWRRGLVLPLDRNRPIQPDPPDALPLSPPPEVT